MKKENKVQTTLKGKETSQESKKENKAKKGKLTTAAEMDNIITGAVGNVKRRSGKKVANQGTVPFYGNKS